MANRGESDLNTFNQRLRVNPQYRAYLQSIGVNPDAPMNLSDRQRKLAESWVRSNVGDIGDLEIDPAGNANQNEGLGKQAAKWGPIVGGAAATLFGVPGLFPGLLTGGGAAAGGAAGAALDAAPNISTAAGMAGAQSLAHTAPSLASALGAAPGAFGAVMDAAPNIATAAGQAGAASLPGTPSLASVLGPAVGGAGGVASALAGGAGGSGLLDKILTGLKDYGPMALGAYGAINGLTQGATPAEDDLSRILKLAEGRITATEPLFNSLNRMVSANLPRYAREG